jgi:hypothetical protein
MSARSVCHFASKSTVYSQVTPRHWYALQSRKITLLSENRSQDDSGRAVTSAEAPQAASGVLSRSCPVYGISAFAVADARGSQMRNALQRDGVSRRRMRIDVCVPCLRREAANRETLWLSLGLWVLEYRFVMLKVSLHFYPWPIDNEQRSATDAHAMSAVTERARKKERGC